MRFPLLASLLGATLLGCTAGDLTVTNTGGSSSSSSTSKSANASSTGAGGAGGASTTASTGGASTTSSTGASGTGGGHVFQASGYSCSGAMPSISAVAAITSKNCATSAACHLGDATAAGIYSSYVSVLSEECTDGRIFVKPGDPEHSYVINKITDKNLCGGVPMPNMGTPLSSTDIQTIYDWICNGALDQ